MDVDGGLIELVFWDSGEQENYDRLGFLDYPGSHVVIISFAIDSPDSLSDVQDKGASIL